jgi:hypothetical protein
MSVHSQILTVLVCLRDHRTGCVSVSTTFVSFSGQSVSHKSGYAIRFPRIYYYYYYYYYYCILMLVNKSFLCAKKVSFADILSLISLVF